MNLVSTVERFFWAMIWVIFILIVGYWFFGWLQNGPGSGNVLGNFAQWVNDHARPQAQ